MNICVDPTAALQSLLLHRSQIILLWTSGASPRNCCEILLRIASFSVCHPTWGSRSISQPHHLAPWLSRSSRSEVIAQDHCLSAVIRWDQRHQSERRQGWTARVQRDLQEIFLANRHRQRPQTASDRYRRTCIHCEAEKHGRANTYTIWPVGPLRFKLWQSPNQRGSRRLDLESTLLRRNCHILA